MPNLLMLCRFFSYLRGGLLSVFLKIFIPLNESSAGTLIVYNLEISENSAKRNHD